VPVPLVSGNPIQSIILDRAIRLQCAGVERFSP
jgi:hypothetical protein